MLLNLEKQNTTNNRWNFFAKFSLFFSSSSEERLKINGRTLQIRIPGYISVQPNTSAACTACGAHDKIVKLGFWTPFHLSLHTAKHGGQWKNCVRFLYC